MGTSIFMVWILEIMVIGLLLNLFFLVFSVFISLIEIIAGNKAKMMDLGIRAQKLIEELSEVLPTWRRVLSKVTLFIPFLAAFMYFKVLLRSFTVPETVIESTLFCAEEQLARNRSNK